MRVIDTKTVKYIDQIESQALTYELIEVLQELEELPGSPFGLIPLDTLIERTTKIVVDEMAKRGTLYGLAAQGVIADAKALAKELCLDGYAYICAQSNLA